MADAALALQVMAGPDPRDATCSTAAADDYLRALTGRVDGVRIGVPRALVSEDAGVDPEIRSAFDRAVETLEAQGAKIVDVALPHSAHAIPVYYLVATAEASSNLARYDGVRFGYRAPDAATLGEMYDRTRDVGFGPEVKRRILLGTYVLSAGYYDAYYLKAQQVRTLIRRDYEMALQTVDLIAMPTSPTPAFALGERMDDPLQMYLADVFTVAANLAGLPSISIPCGFTNARLPCSLQLTGRAMDEATVLRVADAFEHATTYAGEKPPTSSGPGLPPQRRTLSRGVAMRRPVWLGRTRSQTTKPMKRKGKSGTASPATTAMNGPEDRDDHDRHDEQQRGEADQQLGDEE